MQYKHCKEYHEYSIMQYAYVISLNSIDLLKYTSMLCFVSVSQASLPTIQASADNLGQFADYLGPLADNLGQLADIPCQGQFANNPKKFTDNLGRIPVVSYPAKTIRTQFVKSFRIHTNEVWVRNGNEKAVCIIIYMSSIYK